MSAPKSLKEFVYTIFEALEAPTFYWAQYPYNLGYYHENGAFSFDCVNLIKAILNGWTPTRKVGYFENDLSRTKDCTEAGLIEQCSGVSSDFSKLKSVSVLYMPGHIGCYTGEFTRNGRVYNVIECTSNQWGDGVIASYVDAKGRRLKHKGSNEQCGTWTKHGTMKKWLKYPEEENFDYKLALRIAVKIEKGDYGDNPARKQKITKKYGGNYYRAAQDVINYIHKKY